MHISIEESKLDKNSTSHILLTTSTYSIMDETLQAIDLTMPAVPTGMERQPPTDSSDKPPTPESAFLQLPAELRISIYEYVFADSHLLVRKGMGEDRDRKEY